MREEEQPEEGKGTATRTLLTDGADSDAYAEVFGVYWVVKYTYQKE